MVVECGRPVRGGAVCAYSGIMTANARMLLNADSKRRSARNSVRASRPQSTSAVAVHG
jgi:hypothetical protein